MLESFENRVVAILEAKLEGDDIASGNKRFWNDLPKLQHMFSKHPILATYGSSLAAGAYKYTNEQLRKHNASVREAMSIFYAIAQIEKDHHAALEKLAAQLAYQVLGFPIENIDAKIVLDQDEIEANEAGELEVPKFSEADEELRKHVNKRITMHAMTQGSAVHAYMSIYGMVKDELKAIDGRLEQLYYKLAVGSVHQYWVIDLEQYLQSLLGARVGSSRLIFPEDGEAGLEKPEEPEKPEPEESEEPEPEKPEKPESRDVIVKARAVCFPILVQEVFKGVMQAATAHGLQQYDSKTLKVIYANADKVEHEPFLIQVGHELWRKFTAMVKSDKHMPPLHQVIIAMSKMEPDEVHDIVMKCLDDQPDKAVERLRELVDFGDEPEEYKDSEGYEEPEEYEDSEGRLESDEPDHDEPDESDLPED
jgi:hypothetical protein